MCSSLDEMAKVAKQDKARIVPAWTVECSIYLTNGSMGGND